MSREKSKAADAKARVVVWDERKMMRSVLATAVRRVLGAGGTAVMLSLSPTALSQSTFGAVVELSDLDGSDGFVINGVDQNDRFGFSVDGAGDINGDGVADLIIGAPNGTPNGNLNAGQSYAVFGGGGIGSTGVVEVSDLNGSDGFVINGIDRSDGSGRSVSGAGDINGDGVADLIIGARTANPNGNNRAGESYVVFGGGGVGSTGVIELSDLNGSDGFVINGIDADDLSGESVSGVGDINGDGVDDLIIGAYLADSNDNQYAGESYVVFGGGAVGLTGSVELSNFDGGDGFVISGINFNDRSGQSVSGAGDVNGDGVDDLIIGARLADPNRISYAGESYVVFGGVDVGNTGMVELSELDGSDGYVINGISRYDQSGFSVSGAGDINGDGVADLIIGAPNADPNSNNSAGESYVLFGGSHVGSAGVVELSGLDGSNGFVINGIAVGDSSGESVNGVGDLNGDGVDDLIVGADRADPNGNANAGNSYVVFGGGGVGSTGVVELSDLNGSDGFVINGIDGRDYSGRSVRGGGDINGDGLADLIIAAPNASPNGTGSAGESYILFGIPPSILCNGLAVTVDMNEDQIPGPGDDVVLGTPGNDDIRGRAGNDTICGMGGNDFIHGNSGNDWIDGGDGVDELRGGQGDDVLFTGSGATVGTSSIVFGGNGDDEINGGDDADDLRGGRGVDTINGHDGDDDISGNADGDILMGGNGDDILRGGQGDDQLNGDAGEDFLSGGGGSLDVCDGGGVDVDLATASCEVVTNVP